MTLNLEIIDGPPSPGMTVQCSDGYHGKFLFMQDEAYEELKAALHIDGLHDGKLLGVPIALVGQSGKKCWLVDAI